MATVSVPCLCGRSFTVDTALAGSTLKCPTCGYILRVPGDVPTAAPVREPLQSTVAHTPTQPAKPRRRKVPAWAAVGGVGLVVILLVVCIPQALSSYYERRQRTLSEEQSALPVKQQERQRQLEKEVRDGQLVLTVSGPATLQPGAPNAYTLETKSLAGEQVPARLAAVVKDRAGKEVFSQTGIKSGGKHLFTVPLPAALKPDDELTLEISAEREVDGKTISLAEKLPLERPGYVTHLATDKPLYQPGEVVAFRSLTLDRFRLQPVEEDLQLGFTVTDPAGQVVFRAAGSGQLHDGKGGGRLVQGPDGKTVRGIGVGEFAIPANAPGGEYTLAVTELRGRFGPEKRKFLVNRYQAPRLHKELEFTKRSFGPGDEVLAACKVTRIEGGKPLANQPVTATVLLDGKRLAADGTAAENATLSLTTDANGGVAVRFKLPKEIDYGEASLSVQFTDGGNTETIVRPIPVVVRRLRVDFYPEGGDLVAGVPNRVYFQARTPLGKPAELKGRVLDAKGQVVATVETLADEKSPAANQGQGVFTLTPAADATYTLHLDKPAGIPLTYALPKAKDSGVSLKVEGGVSNDAEPIKATVWSAGESRKLLVAAYCRGRVVAAENIEVKAGESKTVALLPPAGIAGVVRVTVFEERAKMTPVAERLAFRRPAQRLDVKLAADKPHYTPGEKVQLNVVALNETKQPAPGIAMVAVVDKAALSLADDRTLRGMPTHFLLAGEVRKPEELEHADFLLSDHPLAPVAVDLLLGTQGWRRFAEQTPAEFREKYKDDAERLLASAGQSPIRATNRAEAEATAQPLLNEAQRKAHTEFAGQRAELATGLRDAEKSHHEWSENADIATKLGGVGLVLLILVVVSIGAIGAMEKSQAGAVVGAFSVVGAFVAVLFLSAVALSMFSCDSQSYGTTKYSRNLPAMAADRNGVGDVGLGGKAPPAPPMQAAGAGSGSGGNPAARQDAAPRVGNRPTMASPPGMPAMPGGPAAGASPPLPADAPPINMPGGPPAATAPGYTTGTPKPPPGDSARRRYADAAQRQQQAPQFPTIAEERSFRDFDRANRGVSEANSLPPFVVREYVHENVPGRESRSDFTETVYWHPVLVLPGGETFVNFHLSDAVTSFQVTAFVHTADGRLGAATSEFASRLPFSLDAKLPAEVTSTDELHVPLAVANDTDARRQVKLTVQASGLTRLDGEAETDLNLAAEQRGRVVYKFKPAALGEARFRLDGRSDFLRDQVERKVTVVPDGFPVAGVKSGPLNRVLAADVNLPADWTKGSLKLSGEVYPSVMADIVTGLEGMLREPHGCFEQTSSSNYPNLLILNYLQQTGQSRPEVARRALELLDRGYNRLLTFECPKAGGGREGFEWFGHNPPHEALTAYGLLQFHDLAKVYDKVDPAMVERTRKFLLARRDGAGNFRREPNYHRFGLVAQPTFNAYIVWALCESEADADLNKEVSVLTEQAKSNADAYFLALVANSLFLRNNKADGEAILDKLAAQQSADGSLSGRETIVGSYGRDIQIETTALAVLAWLKSAEPLKHRTAIAKASQWLSQQRGAWGGFGSTQATVLTLKALAKLATDSKKLTPGDVILSVNGQPILRQPFAATATDTLKLELPDAEKLLKPGQNTIRLELTGGGELPGKITWAYHTIQPPSSDRCPVKLTTKLDKTKAGEGDTVRLTAVVENTAKGAVSMTVAVIGLPAGLTLPEDLKQLTELAKPKTPLAGRDTPERGTIDYFEVRGRELVLYWRGLDAGQRVELPLDLVCRVPGSYRGPASRAYLYYGADDKCWAPPLAVGITAK